ncbi:MAG: hypothetical protein GX278_02130 [Aeromonadales bacterium]|nr:hypothetical protein [Aeromonadales bacterium]
MAIVKDAQYYIGTINDLSSFLQDSINELYKEAASHRYVMMTLNELCKKLSLDYTKKSFESNASYNYVSINAYLEKLNLKLIPCSVPVDLSFNDNIYVTVNPNLTNDEDCAYVKRLIQEKRAVTPKDSVHISKMNDKLSNYNVLLRVFEALFVVSPIKLDPHQRMAVNKIINELVLPKEGLIYLRSCYTYASEQRNRHASFSDPKYCFKPLKDEQQHRVTRYLAYVAIHSSYLSPFAQDYPYYKQLEEEVKKLGKPLPLTKTQSQLNAELKRSVDPTGTAPKNIIKTLDFKFLDSTNNSVMLVHTHYTNRPLDTKKYLQNNPISKNRLVYNYLIEAGKGFDESYEILFPNKEHLKEIDFSSIANRPFNSLYITDSFKISSIYPNVVLVDKFEEANLGKLKLPEEFTQFLTSKINTTPSLANTGEYKSVLKLSNMVLFYNLFMQLIIKPAFIEFDKEDTDKGLRVLSKELCNHKDSDLFFIDALHFALFELFNTDFSKNKLRSSTVLGLYNFEEVCMLCVASLLNSGIKNSIDEYYAYAPRLFEIYILNSLKTSLPNEVLTKIKSRSNVGYLVEFLANIIKGMIKKDGISSFIKVVDSKDYNAKKDYFENKVKDVIEVKEYCTDKLQENIALSKSKDDITGKKIQELHHFSYHQYAQNFVLPILSENCLSAFTNQKIICNKAYVEELSFAIEESDSQVKYLKGLTLNNKLNLAKLITSNLSKVDEQIIKRNLKNLCYSKSIDLCAVIDVEFSYTARECIENYLPKLGLMIVPIDSSLPSNAKSQYKFHKIINTHLEPNQLDRDFCFKLSAAQLAFIIFYYIVPISSSDVRLARLMVLSPEQNVYALKFFSTLKEMIKGTKPFTDRFYESLYASYRNNDNFKLCIKYLKQLAIEEVENSPLQNYLQSQFNHLFDLLGPKHANKSAKTESVKVQTTLDINDIDTRKLKDTIENKKHSEKTVVNTSYRNYGNEDTEIKYSEHSFFKPTVFDARKLNTSLIESKLKESSEIQSFINKIREEEGNIEVFDDEVSLDSKTQNTDVSVSDKESETEAQKPQSNSIYSKLSENCIKLIEAIHLQNSDIIDLNEFAGLCLSLKFMSQDAAVEEVNDWSYENFDDPIFDVAPKEKCVYITTDIISEIIDKLNS